MRITHGLKTASLHFVKPSQGTAVVSVVIPAHNEETVISRCLTSLLNGLQENDHEIIVVCNGCSDRTAERARQFRSVRVIELSLPSKIGALNAGLNAASMTPLAFVDADVELSGADLLKAVEQMELSGAKIVAPQLHVDLAGASFAVKSFYSVWTRLPYFSQGQMVGSGVFILSEEGKRRIDQFPSLISDDGYARALFSGEERLTASNCYFRIFAPKTSKDLIRIKARVRLGNAELSAKYPELKAGSENTLRSMVVMVIKAPWLLLASFVYVWVQLCTARESKRRMAIADFKTWDRDESSR